MGSDWPMYRTQERCSLYNNRIFCKVNKSYRQDRYAQRQLTAWRLYNRGTE
ncbi:hypothetical protein [Paenibacillus radicis (ex Xue et al. 2023)]|uniref:Uncharacterized protein n=1 Tax=Paenibacillus radicis (ex Xue et al. 2023) TaxID=2972489 RepID=A0ABT1YCQ8_9BACL|nr:hypothetical protein [Paenibacillus radicis (ex Xue et al. 2023)]MCR8630968.1 hypothetical protein [Paenibacillus radicis (ex Xue et al. 2023)]